MKKRRVEITVEQKWLVFRRGTTLPSVLCDQCPGQPAPSVMLPPEEAAVLAGVSTRTLYRWVEAGQIHFTEVQDGLLKRLLVCLNSAPLARGIEDGS